MTKTRDLANLIADSKVGPSEIDTTGTYNMNALQVGGTTVINSSRGGALTSLALTGNATFADNGKAIFGAGSDLQIYHDGSNSFISDQGTGNLKILADDFRIRNATDTDSYIFVNSGAEVGLTYSGATKLATTSTGVDITGTAVTDGVTVAGNLSVDGGTIKLDGNYPVGTNNVALGDTAFDSVTTGDQNVAIGASALTATTDGRNNTAVGEEALAASTSDNNNTAVGKQSMTATDGGTLNAAFGSDTMKANTTGDNNVAVGAESLFSNTTASSNTAVGYQAAYSNTTGATNTALGQWSLYDNTSGSNNVALGRDALQNNTTASNNTAVGYQAGYSNTTSPYNTFIGGLAGKDTTGSRNTFLGYNSGLAVTSGEKNTILGRYSGNQGGLDIRTSSNNIVLSDGDGNPRGSFDSNGTFRIGNFGNWGASVKLALASDCSTGVMAEFNNLNTASSDNIIRFRRNGTEAGKIVVTTSNTTQYLTSSDYRLKENVVELTGATDRLKQIPVHRFNFIADPNITVDGFLAHEVQSVVPEAIHGTKDEVDDGNPVYQGIDQSKLVPLLVATIQELEARITALENA